jgi:hypothetical protein
MSFCFALILGLMIYGLSQGHFFFPDIITLIVLAGIILYCFKYAKKVEGLAEIGSDKTSRASSET